MAEVPEGQPDLQSELQSCKLNTAPEALGGERDWGAEGERITETLSGFCWGLCYGLINIPLLLQ